MNPFTLHEPADQAFTSQLTLSAAVVVAAHVGVIAAAMAWYQQTPVPGVEIAAITVDMAPAAAAPALQPQDLAPGPQMQQADAASEPQPVQRDTQAEPEPAHQSAMHQPETAAAQPEPEVVLPARPTPLAKPAPSRIERARPEPKRVVRDRAAPAAPAPRTTAPPKADRQASLLSSPRAGSAAAAAALPSYRDRLAAHLARFKQYPAPAKAAGEQGTAMLSFTVGRGGQVLGSRLARSSGHPSLDAETMAMIRRAQPLPPFPPELAQGSLSFTVPVRFSLR